MSDAIDAAMLAEQRAGSQPLLDLRSSDTCTQELRPGHHPVPRGGHLPEFLLNRPALHSHCEEKSGRMRNSPRQGPEPH
jgi:hypothetical protein